MIAWRPLLRPTLALLGLFLLSRVILLLVGILTIDTIDSAANKPPGDSLAALFCRWDCGWYMRIWEHGYSAARAPAQPGATDYAFFPLFPLSVRALAKLTGMNGLHAALWVSNVAFLLALDYIYRYARAVGASEHGALLTGALLCFLPQSFVFSAAYIHKTQTALEESQALVMQTHGALEDTRAALMRTQDALEDTQGALEGTQARLDAVERTLVWRLYSRLLRVIIRDRKRPDLAART